MHQEAKRPLGSDRVEQNLLSTWRQGWASQHEADDHNLVFDALLHSAIHNAISALCFTGDINTIVKIL